MAGSGMTYPQSLQDYIRELRAAKDYDEKIKVIGEYSTKRWLIGVPIVAGEYNDGFWKVNVPIMDFPESPVRIAIPEEIQGVMENLKYQFRLLMQN